MKNDSLTYSGKRSELTLSTFCAFEVDDVAIGTKEAMISIGRRRFLLRNLSTDDVQALSVAHRTGELDAASVPRNLFVYLTEIGAVWPCPGSKRRKKLRRLDQLLISSNVVARICSLFKIASTASGLSLLLLLSLTGVTVVVLGDRHWISLATWLSAASPGSIATAALIFLLCIFFHELGHGAACLLRSGLVGAITVRLRAGVPVFTTDVSSVHRLTRQGKAAVAISGVIFQASLSAVLLLSSVPSAQIAAKCSMMSVAFALIPLPGSDGYWFISDYFRTTLVGYFGTHGRSDRIGAVYTAFLLLVTAYFVYILAGEGILLFASGMERLVARKYSGLGFMSLAAYLFIILILFSRRIILFVRSGPSWHS